MALKLVNIRKNISLQKYKDKSYKHFRACFIQKKYQLHSCPRIKFV